MIGNKIAAKTRSVSKKSNNNNNNEDVETTAHKIDTYPQKKRQQIIGELRLAPKKDVYF